MFIRIVVSKSDDTNLRNSLVPNMIGGSRKLSAEDILTPIDATGTDYEFKEPVYACGCVRTTVVRFTVVSTLLFILFEGLAVGVNTLFVAFATIFLVIGCVGCNMLCCPCCQPPKGTDE